MDHTRPYEEPADTTQAFGFGDWALWFDPHHGWVQGRLMCRQSSRTWLAHGADGRTYDAVDEAALVLVEHDQEFTHGQEALSAPAESKMTPTRERFDGGARPFKVRLPDLPWEEACLIWADTVIRQNGLVVFARDGEVVRTFVEDDVEVRNVAKDRLDG